METISHDTILDTFDKLKLSTDSGKFVSSHNGVYTKYGEGGIRNSYETWETGYGYKYIKMKVLISGEERETLFDLEDLEKIKGCGGVWYLGKNNYVINSLTKKYLHHLVMDFKGSGRGFQQESIDHINRDPLDNRKSNLRLATAKMQQENSKGRIEGTKRERQKIAVDLPGVIEQTDMPRYISYRKEKLKEYFVIEEHPAYIDKITINGNEVPKTFKSIQAMWVDQYATDREPYPIKDKLDEMKKKCDILDKAVKVYKTTNNRAVVMEECEVLKDMFTQRKAKNTKKVYKYDRNNNLVGEYESIIDAVRNNDISEATIRRQLKDDTIVSKKEFSFRFTKD